MRTNHLGGRQHLCDPPAERRRERGREDVRPGCAGDTSSVTILPPPFRRCFDWDGEAPPLPLAGVSIGMREGLPVQWQSRQRRGTSWRSTGACRWLTAAIPMENRYCSGQMTVSSTAKARPSRTSPPAGRRSPGSAPTAAPIREVIRATRQEGSLRLLHELAHPFGHLFRQALLQVTTLNKGAVLEQESPPSPGVSLSHLSNILTMVR